MLPSLKNNTLLFGCILQIAYCLSTELQPSCKSQIFCESDFLHDVQLARIYPDSKTFVDMKLKYNESDIISRYKTFKDKYNAKRKPKYSWKIKLEEFVNRHLEESDELEKWTPLDFKDNPSIVDRIKDPTYKQWAYELNGVWKTLARKVKDDVKTNQDRYSLIWVENGFVIPGGRFKELYYWDNYWMVNGLLLCDMIDTARGVIDNIVSMVNRFGFMPNGGRVYYLNRSNPPMLVLTALSYYEATDDFDYIKSIMPVLEKEFEFWMKNRLVTFSKDDKEYTMARYYVPSRGPRPESYREDYEIAEKYETETEKNDFYIRIKSGAETGWDYSTRWFISANGSNRGDLSDVRTPDLVTVDLNSIMHVNAMTLSTWFEMIGDTDKSKTFSNIAHNFLTGIQEVLWNEDRGAWFDWDIKNGKSRDYFYVSNIVPLWTESYNMPKDQVARKVLTYLANEKIVESDYSISLNGTPTSMTPSPQQWDFPNAWPPLQTFIVQGLDKTGHKQAQEVAEKLASAWLYTNYNGYEKHSAMFEKYNVSAAGETGSGGEYTPQTGFGWTNGVVFDFLNRWSDTASYGSPSSKQCSGQTICSDHKSTDDSQETDITAYINAVNADKPKVNINLFIL